MCKNLQCRTVRDLVAFDAPLSDMVVARRRGAV